MDSTWRIWDAYEVIRLPGYVKAVRIGPDNGGGIVVDDHELLLTREDAKLVCDAVSNYASATDENRVLREALRQALSAMENARFHLATDSIGEQVGYEAHPFLVHSIAMARAALAERKTT